MSYILEALRKAEAERQGATQAVLRPGLSAYAQRPPAWRTPWPWIALSALAVALAAGAWFTALREDKPAAAPMPAPQPAQAIVQKSKEESVPVQEARPAEPPAIPKETVAKRPAPKKRQPIEEEAKKPAPAEPPVATLRELPEKIQREIPPLAVGGYIYSNNQADRSVLINKRLLREGDEVAPGLVLEKMQPNGMVLNYQGHRFRTGY